jgi:HlyD family secretion protein
MNTWLLPENYKYKTMKRILPFIFIVALAISCNRNQRSDAYGNFEAVEVTVSAETSGRIVRMDLEEGRDVVYGDTLALVDTIDLALKRDQIVSQLTVLQARMRNVDAQIRVQEQQKKNLMVEKNRLDNLIKDGAATQKQMDDMTGNLDLLEQQILSTSVQKESILAEMATLAVQVSQVDETIRKCWILSPLSGTVLVRYAELGEITATGRPVCKIAQLGELELKVYISGDQLPYLELGQQVEVLIDDAGQGVSALEGRVSWISSKAEFTPKTIQTRKERVNLVYAAKVMVPNDGRLKIGMPAEINFMKNIDK